ncbi:hypothetical protein HDE69_002810 [Pedobacter cryoconitis]|uniref:Uncharacterized protein n=1 Tax=Pedobacter cryoconitis TaxID=188932 RepID=A0A7W8YTY8_9SPHI|nr:hypothetical protein [Pedobacter cryoconitis]MBB5644123.1 hypothetical protein [Pedobacter cryoconitis]
MGIKKQITHIMIVESSKNALFIIIAGVIIASMVVLIGG